MIWRKARTLTVPSKVVMCGAVCLWLAVPCSLSLPPSLDACEHDSAGVQLDRHWSSCILLAPPHIGRRTKWHFLLDDMFFYGALQLLPAAAGGVQQGRSEAVRHRRLHHRQRNDDNGAQEGWYFLPEGWE